MAHLEDQESLKQLVYISWHDCYMRSPLGTRAVWFSLVPGATSILLSSSHGCDRGLQHLLWLWLRFVRRNRESQHITSCLISRCLSLKVSRLLSVSPSVASTYAHKLETRHSLKFLWKPQTLPFTHPTLITPLRLTCACVCARTYIHVHTDTHTHTAKDPVYLKELKGGLPHQLFCVFLQRSELSKLASSCARTCCGSSPVSRAHIS